MMKPRVTLRGLVIKEFMWRYRNNQYLYTCHMLDKCLKVLVYDLDKIAGIGHQYLYGLKLKYTSNFDETVFLKTPSPKERLQNLLDFIKSEDL